MSEKIQTSQSKKEYLKRSRVIGRNRQKNRTWRLDQAIDILLDHIMQLEEAEQEVGDNKREQNNDGSD